VSATTSIAVSYAPCWRLEQVEAAMRDLAARRETPSQRGTERRQAPRRDYAGPVLVELVPGADDEPLRRRFQVFAHNLSRSGIGLLLPLTFAPQEWSHFTPLVQTESILLAGSKLKVGLLKEGVRMLWIEGTLVRTRRLPFDLIEAGVRFGGRRSAAALDQFDQLPSKGAILKVDGKSK
jgi:hypothetical protein